MKHNVKSILAQHHRALERRGAWEGLWKECYAYSLPQRDGISTNATPGSTKTAQLFDGTAPDAVDQLASSLLGELTPPWGKWFKLSAGSEVSPEVAAESAQALEQASEALHSNFERSNFAIEMHQCFLDLVTVGTACLLFEEAPMGHNSAFKFTAIPLQQVAFEEGIEGGLSTTYRKSTLSKGLLLARFPEAESIINKTRHDSSEAQDNKTYSVIETVSPDMKFGGYTYTAILDQGNGLSEGDTSQPLATGHFEHTPFINFRWLKAPGELYGRSPIMKTLPDIKTANKVVELVLKNATIAVTGIWQADDDGVLNPATIQLTPGTIIPKAVGSQGLTPLVAPGRFDVSELVLGDLRARIRKALLVDNLSQVNSPKMTATEVLERSAEMTRLLGATYGRLQSELMAPLMNRAIAILSRRGDIPAMTIDGRAISLTWRSPLAKAYTRHEARDAMHWVSAIQSLGPSAIAEIDTKAMVRWLAKAFDIPPDLIRKTMPLNETSEMPPILDNIINSPEAQSLVKGLVQ